MFAFLLPRYMKQARLLHKGVTRFIHYKRDILPPDKLQEITTLRTSLEDAMRVRDRSRIDALTKEINGACEKALPDAGRSDLADNIEVFFVAIVVAFGIRSYILQPFKIPTGSMQPTLYGIVANPTEEDSTPGLFRQAADFVTGRSHIHVVSDHTGTISNRQPLTEHGVMGFFTHCKLHFEDGHSIRIWAPMAQLINSHYNLGLFERVGAYPEVDRSKITPDMIGQRYVGALGGRMVTKGQVIASGTLDTGDHVLVNKFAYHFRRPTRGEVFVFTTKNIRSAYMNVPAEQGSQHYIKRLVGVPGDTLEVRPPALWVNGKPAEETGMQRVASMQGLYNRGYGALLLLSEGRQVRLKDEEYWAMGDNSFNSSDSRYWGSVPERNLVGPGLFCYFPFGRNWGVIR
ncbi:MAG: signal peptidase I [Verrucomicrobiaceae bacterium]|nr:signal peptidase I [Verrucomicrobiaceae bacterium]